MAPTWDPYRLNLRMQIDEMTASCEADGDTQDDGATQSSVGECICASRKVKMKEPYKCFSHCLNHARTPISVSYPVIPQNTKQPCLTNAEWVKVKSAVTAQAATCGKVSRRRRAAVMDGEPAAEAVATEAVATETVAAETVAVEAVAAEPVAVEAVAAEPVAAEPVAAKPVAAEPVAAEPVAAEPVAAEPAVEKPLAPKARAPPPPRRKKPEPKVDL